MCTWCQKVQNICYHLHFVFACLASNTEHFAIRKSELAIELSEICLFSIPLVCCKQKTCGIAYITNTNKHFITIAVKSPIFYKHQRLRKQKHQKVK